MADAGVTPGTELTQLLLAAAQRLAESIDPEHVYDSFHELLDEVVPHNGVVVSSFDPGDGLIRCEYAWVEGSRIDELTLPPPASIFAAAVDNIGGSMKPSESSKARCR